MRFALLNAELTVKKVDYDYVHDARCSIQSYNRELRRQALQFAREKEVLATAEQIDAAEMKIRAMLEEGKTITEARALMKYHSLQTPTK